MEPETTYRYYCPRSNKPGCLGPWEKEAIECATVPIVRLHSMSPRSGRNLTERDCRPKLGVDSSKALFPWHVAFVQHLSIWRDATLESGMQSGRIWRFTTVALMRHACCATPILCVGLIHPKFPVQPRIPQQVVDNSFSTEPAITRSNAMISQNLI